jgi:chorismate mutase/prephenate dehydratase
MGKAPTLDEIRARIDELDARLVALIGERAALVVEAARAKSENGAPESYYRPDREAAILRRVMEQNQGPLSNEAVGRLWRELMSECLALEQKLRIAYLGPEGTFTHAALLKHFGQAVETVPQAGIDLVFREVELGNCHYGVVPVENSIEGVVTHTLDLLANSALKICGEIALRIQQHLLSKSADLKSIRKVYSHQQSISQCRRWLDDHLPQADRIAVSSNAEAARRAADETGSAAIAGEFASQRWSLPIAVRSIEDEPDNTTRFLVLGRHAVAPGGRDRTSLVFATPNRPGALHDMLHCFAVNNVSLSRIESRPSRRGMWDYIFFADIEGHAQDAPVAAALRELAERASMVKVLGSYPQAPL